MIKSLPNPFRKPSARSLAQLEYEEAQRQLLVYQTQQEYTNRMVQFYQDKTKRLANYLKEEA